MSAKSAEVLSLLQELSLPKKMDAENKQALNSELEMAEFERRQARRREISDQIKSLGGL
jgi:hypothetical protein